MGGEGGALLVRKRYMSTVRQVCFAEIILGLITVLTLGSWSTPGPGFKRWTTLSGGYM